MGGIDSLTGGESFWDGFISGAASGSVMGAVGPFFGLKFMLLATAYLTSHGVYDAYLNDRPWQALWRVASGLSCMFLLGGGIKYLNKPITVYRVEGRPNTRIEVGPNGNVRNCPQIT